MIPRVERVVFNALTQTALKRGALSGK